MKPCSKPDGVITWSFRTLMRLMNENQFDTIYHEHFSYFSFIAARNLCHHGINCSNVEELSTHGGSLRSTADTDEDGTKP